MSSAILYLAIIAIWLCVLIPRWLKRDSAHGGVVTADAAAASGDGPVPAADGDGAGDFADDGTGQGDEHPSAAATAGKAGKAPSAAPLSAEEARRRIVGGRRRLLGMLIALEIAASAAGEPAVLEGGFGVVGGGLGMLVSWPGTDMPCRSS